MPSPASSLSAPLPEARGISRGRWREWLLPSPGMARRPWVPALGFLYIAAVDQLGGLRGDHVLLGLLGLLDVYNERSRLFLRAFFPFILTGVVFDSMRYFYQPAIAGRVHVAGPYLLERAWFGVGGRTLNELFLDRHWAALDLACGFAYLVYVAEYIGLAMVLFLRDRPHPAATFARCFLLVNVLGFVTYFAFPVAPPWYVTQYGLDAVQLVRPNPAAAHRFDVLLGTRLFDQMYGRGVDAFGAIPSLHVAYPCIAAILTFQVAGLRWARVPAVLFLLLVAFSAVYLQHHYVIDVLLGAVYAVATVCAVAAWERWRAGRAG